MMVLSSLFETVFPDANNNNNNNKSSSSASPIKSYSTANPPHKDSGIQRLTPPFLALFGLLTAVYTVLYMTFQHSEFIFGLQPAAEFCENRPDDEPVCSRSDLFAFQAVSGLAFMIMGGYGFYCWHIAGLHKKDIPQTPQGRCLSYTPDGEFISLVCFTYQVWDLVFSLIIPEHRTPIMLMHHTLASAVSFSGLYAQYMIWYGFYFFGLSEVSSLFLVLMDVAKFFPPAEGSSFAAFISMYCGPMFALTFLFYRGIMWWYITYMKFSDCYHLIKTGQAEKHRPGKTWVLYVLMGFNIPMGMLQLYWSSLIVQEIQKLVAGEA